MIICKKEIHVLFMISKEKTCTLTKNVCKAFSLQPVHILRELIHLLDHDGNAPKVMQLAHVLLSARKLAQAWKWRRDLKITLYALF